VEAFAKDNPQAELHIHNSAYNLYRMDAEEYLEMSWPEMNALADQYYTLNLPRFQKYENKDDYYRSLGKDQLCRQVVFHSRPEVLGELEVFLASIDTSREAKGLDYGCGSAPVGFELMLRGHKMDFVDLDGAPAYEFTKWRTKKRGMVHRAGFELGGPYNYALFMDSIEHLANWKEVLGDVCDRLVENGCIITNYFLNEDYENVEHISMDHKAVADFLVSKGIYPLNKMFHIKRNLAAMDKPKEKVA
jgi:hypothetical protein